MEIVPKKAAGAHAPRVCPPDYIGCLEEDSTIPEKKTVNKARKRARRGQAPSTQAGEFVREEIHHVREGKHGARSTKQAIAIGLSRAREAGVDLPPAPEGTPSAQSRADSCAKRLADADCCQSVDDTFAAHSVRQSVVLLAVTEASRSCCPRRGTGSSSDRSP